MASPQYLHGVRNPDSLRESLPSHERLMSRFRISCPLRTTIGPDRTRRPQRPTRYGQQSADSERAPAGAREKHGDLVRDPGTIKEHARALATLASIVWHFWTADERELLKHLSNNSEKLATTAKRLGWDGQCAHKTVDKILRHAKAALQQAS